MGVPSGSAGVVVVEKQCWDVDWRSESVLSVGRSRHGKQHSTSHAWIRLHAKLWHRYSTSWARVGAAYQVTSQARSRESLRGQAENVVEALRHRLERFGQRPMDTGLFGDIPLYSMPVL